VEKYDGAREAADDKQFGAVKIWFAGRITKARI